MKRANILTMVLITFTLVQWFAFPVEMSIGDPWRASRKKLSLVPRIDVAVGYRFAQPVESTIFLLPDLTCVEIIATPRESDGIFVIESIHTGPRFGGYPGKYDWDDEFATSPKHLSLSNYTFPRFLSYACVAVLFWQLFSRYKKSRVAMPQMPN